ncbi:MAG: sodium:solute symporter family protein, partial [Duodenibacillus sp.]|nr:sodium:solute symporter family protein [Duodenibacillus sp.]
TNSTISRDFYQKLFKRDATDAETLKLSRVVTVVLGLVAILIGIAKPGSIFQIILFSFGGLGIWAAPIVIGMYWKRTSKAAVFVSMILGESLYFVILTKAQWLAFGFNPLIVAWLFTCAVLVVVSLFTKPASEAAIERHFGP